MYERREIEHSYKKRRKKNNWKLLGNKKRYKRIRRY